jgi:hypothetical protein
MSTEGFGTGSGIMIRILWTQKQDEGPSPRTFSAMGYDSVRGRAVLFGGGGDNVGSAVLRDTWEWDGAAWTQISSFGAQPCGLAAMAFKADSVALFGGAMSGINNPNGLTWTWGRPPSTVAELSCGSENGSRGPLAGFFSPGLQVSQRAIGPAPRR